MAVAGVMTFHYVFTIKQKSVLAVENKPTEKKQTQTKSWCLDATLTQSFENCYITRSRHKKVDRNKLIEKSPGL